MLLKLFLKITLRGQIKSLLRIDIFYFINLKPDGPWFSIRLYEGVINL